jgi:hypothetical protein
MKVRIPRGAVILALILGVVLAGAAYATIPDGDGVIHGCYTKKGGLLRVIDAPKQSCTSLETAISWNQKGPVGPIGPAGPTGPAGPAGPAGTISDLDELDGLPCAGVDGKPASVRLVYGSGTEAPVSILCVTHLVANPGDFTVDATDGLVSVGLEGPLPLPTTGWKLAGKIDTGGKITVPNGDFTVPGADWQVSGTGYSASGTVSLTTDVVGGSLDPSSGEASLDVRAYAAVSIHATSILGLGYSGTCYLASAASPMKLPFSTAPPGVPYDQTDGSATLSASFDTPALTSCSPQLPSFVGGFAQLFAGSSQLTFSGTTTPIIKAP